MEANETFCTTAKLFRVVGPATKVGEAAALAEYVFDGPTSENGAGQGEKKTARQNKSAKRPRERQSWDAPRLLSSWSWHQLFTKPFALRTRLRHDRHEITKKTRPIVQKNQQKNPTNRSKKNQSFQPNVRHNLI